MKPIPVLPKVLIGSGMETISQGNGFVIRPLATNSTIVIPEVKVNPGWEAAIIPLQMLFQHHNTSPLKR